MSHSVGVRRKLTEIRYKSLFLVQEVYMVKDKIPGHKRRLTEQERDEQKRQLINNHYRKYNLDVIEEEIIAKVDSRFRDLSTRSNKTDWSVPVEEPMKIWEGFVAERKMTRRYVDVMYEIASHKRNE